MAFAPKSGCPMCGIVAKALHSAPNSPAIYSAQAAGGPLPRIQRLGRPGSGADDKAPEILWRDDNFTVYRERAHPVSSRGHLVIVFNLHVPSIYMLSSSDVPLLISLRALAHRFLSTLSPPSHLPSSSNPSASSNRSISPLTLSSPPLPPSSSPSRTTTSASASSSLSLDPSQSHFRVGFITPPFKDSAIPIKDHLHAHAYIAPHDLCGWWRGVAYSSLAWYAVEDLIAEIREETSNNRIKSGYENRPAAPIDRIPDAGARSGTADGHETTEGGLSVYDVEAGVGVPQSPGSAREGSARERTPTATSPTSYVGMRPLALGSGSGSSSGSGSGSGSGDGASTSGAVIIERDTSYSSTSTSSSSAGGTGLSLSLGSSAAGLSSRPSSRKGTDDHLLSPMPSP